MYISKESHFIYIYTIAFLDMILQGNFAVDDFMHDRHLNFLSQNQNQKILEAGGLETILRADVPPLRIAITFINKIKVLSNDAYQSVSRF